MKNKIRDLLEITKIDISKSGKNSRMILGDLSANGQLDILMIQPDGGIDDRYVPHQSQFLTAYDAEGNILWQKGEADPNPGGAGSDLPVQIYDIDQDGYNEVLCVMDKEFLILDGRTGKLKESYQLPGENAHDCIIIANLRGKEEAQDIILKDRYHKLWALDNNFNLLWTHEGNVGHYPWPCDVNNDGYDEVMAGYDLLDHKGNVLWSCKDLDDHADCIFIGNVSDKTGDDLDLVIGGSVTVLYDWQGNEIWRYEDSVESQHIALGRYCHDSDEVQIAGLDRVIRGHENGKDAMFMLSSEGKEVWKEDRKTKGWLTIIETVSNWNGENKDYILAYRRGGGITPALYDGYMNKLVSFPRDGYVVYGDIYGINRTNVIIYDDNYAYIYGSSDKVVESYDDKARKQTKRLSHATLYPGGELI
ncbi:hypothetical protein [Natronospora cellulosivora (SeqCode)]